MESICTDSTREFESHTTLNCVLSLSCLHFAKFSESKRKCLRKNLKQQMTLRLCRIKDFFVFCFSVRPLNFQLDSDDYKIWAMLKHELIPAKKLHLLVIPVSSRERGWNRGERRPPYRFPNNHSGCFLRTAPFSEASRRLQAKTPSESKPTPNGPHRNGLTQTTIVIRSPYHAVMTCDQQLDHAQHQAMQKQTARPKGQERQHRHDVRTSGIWQKDRKKYQQ